MNSSSEEPLSSLTCDKMVWSKYDLEPKIDSYIASDAHLQSLGLSMDSGKPRFKLNEECSNLPTSSMSLLNYQNIQDNPQSQSFVVLSHPSLEMVQAQSLANYIEIQEKKTSIDYNSVISSMSPLEIEQRLTDMLHENLKLKQTLLENNLAMKKQFNSLAAWQEAVSSVHENHKQKFYETRELIDHLKEENLKLKMELSESQLRNISECRMTAESLSIPPSLPKACNCLNRDKLIESLNNKVTDLINHDKNCETPIVEIDVSPKNSVTDFTLKNLNIDPNLKFEGYKESEINRLKEEVTNSEEKVVTTSTSIQLPNFIELIENLTPQVELRQELIENVKPYYENLEKFVNYFSGQKIVKEHLNNATDDGHWMLIKNQLQEIFSDYTSTLCKLEALKKNMDLLKTQSKDSEQKSRQEEQALRSFTFEEELSQITLEKCSLEEQRKSLDKFREILLTNQENLNTQVEILKLEKLNLSQEKTALDRQSKLYEEQEKALIIEKKNSLKVSAELNEKIINLEEHLKKQNELSYVDKENVMVLRAQLDIYRTDFEQEKSAKKNLIREKNKLIEQIQAVTVQNQELRNDIDKLRQQIQQLQGPNNSSKSQSTSKNSETVDSSSTAAIQIYSCPLCCQKFSSYEPLEQHADECIRLSEGN